MAINVKDVDLKLEFRKINETHFKASLKPEIQLRWNSRLRTSAGRFIPGRRKWLHWMQSIPTIEIAHYLLEETRGLELIQDTLAHEMIHYWLWSRRRPYGHNEEFIKKMNEMGVSRYNSVPRQRPHQHVYQCPHCQKEIPARKKLGNTACAGCCKVHNRGKYHFSFKLVYLGPKTTPQI